MSRRSLNVGELAVHFVLEPIDIEWLLYRRATGMSWPELIEEIQRLDCTRAEAERLATHIRQSAALHDVSLLSQQTGGLPVPGHIRCGFVSFGRGLLRENQRE